jgi:hypothetical protein
VESAALGSPADAAGLNFRTMLREFVPDLYKGFGPAYGLLMLGGLFVWRRTWLRQDHRPLLYASLALLAGIWCHLWIGHATCPRYLLPIVIVASPFAALGLLGLVGQLTRAAERRRAPARLARLAIAATLALVAGGEAGLTIRNDFQQRRAEAELGHWLHQRYGPNPVLAGPHGLTDVVNYYAKGSCQSFPPNAPLEEVLAVVGQAHPDILLLVCTRHRDYHDPETLQGIRRAGLKPSDGPKLPGGCSDLMLFVRQGSRREGLW